MNTTFQLLALGLICLFIVLVAIAFLGLLWNQYKKGAFFCFLPANHGAMISINKKPICMLLHDSDRVITESVINEMEAEKIIDAPYRDVLLNLITSHKDGIRGLLVSLFNLHYTHWNPFTTIEPLEVIPEGLKPKTEILPGSKLVTHMKDVKPISEKFLRLSWPRTVYIHEVEMKNLFSANFIAGFKGLRAWNFLQIYYKFNGKISAEVDTTISAMFIHHFEAMTLEDFQKADLTANTGPDSLFSKMKLIGLEAIGLYLEGPIEVSDWERGEDQEEIRNANLELAAAGVKSQTIITLADANAGKTRREGQAEADVIEMKGKAEAKTITKITTAEAKGSTKRVAAYNGDTKSAALVETANKLPGLKAIGNNTLLNLGD